MPLEGVPSAGLASRVDPPPKPCEWGVDAHRHQAKSAGMLEPSTDTGPPGSLSKASVSFHILTSSRVGPPTSLEANREAEGRQPEAGWSKAGTKGLGAGGGAVLYN